MCDVLHVHTNLLTMQKYGTGKTEIQAKVWYLTSVKHYPLYGSMLYYVTYKGFWSHPNSLILAVDVGGVKFVNAKTKQVSESNVIPFSVPSHQQPDVI